MGSQMDYRVASDPAGQTQAYMKAFGLNGIPSAFIVDKKGQLRWGGHPMSPEFEQELSKAVAESVVQLKDLSEGELKAMSVKDLKKLARENHIDVSTCLEKSEIVSKLKQ